MPANPEIVLSDGGRIPQIGYGTWQVKTAPMEIVYEAIKAGFRHIDCAMIYLNQKEVGKGIAKAIEEGIVSRNDLWITGKLWLTDFDPKRVEKAVRESLSDLGLSYVDLFMPHWPCPLSRAGIPEAELFPKPRNGEFLMDTIPLIETWKALEACKAKGLIRHLAVSNFSVAEIQALESGGASLPVLNQVECHVFFPQTELFTAHKALGIAIEAYCPLGVRPDQGMNALTEPAIQTIATKHGVQPVHVVMRWHLQRGIIPICRTEKIPRLAENFVIPDFKLDEEDLQQIASLARPDGRTINPTFRTGKFVF